MPRRAPRSSSDGHGTRAKIITAAIKLLRDDGVAGVTTRRVALQAEVNPALVHYYFASVDSLMLEVVERIAKTHIESHETKYSEDDDFYVAWRADMAELLAEDPLQGQTKVWFEAMAVVWNSPALSHRYGVLHRARSRQVMKAAAEREMVAHGRDVGAAADSDALAVLIGVVRSGISLDRLLGFEEGHEAAVELLGRLVESVLRPEPLTVDVSPSADGAKARAVPAKRAATRRSPRAKARPVQPDPDGE